jgi:hypothetical protein
MNMNPIVNAGIALELEVDRLLDPALYWDHPRDVVDDPLLSRSEKKAILASWASDRCAVASNPLLRKPEKSRQPIRFEDVMDALKQLDAQERTAPSARANRRPTAAGRSGAAA